jgi:hypothetical protein
MGFNILADMANLGLPYQHESVATTDRFIRERPVSVRKFLRALIAGIHLRMTDEKKWLPGLDPDFPCPSHAHSYWTTTASLLLITTSRVLAGRLKGASMSNPAGFSGVREKKLTSS